MDLALEITGNPLTEEDLLQPNDFPLLEENPHFRYQEGIVAGILMVQTAFQLKAKECIR